MKRQPIGFVCKCGIEHRFPLYVAAHWEELLDFTCPSCKLKLSVFRGVVQNEYFRAKPMYEQAIRARDQ